MHTKTTRVGSWGNRLARAVAHFLAPMGILTLPFVALAQDQACDMTRGLDEVSIWVCRTQVAMQAYDAEQADGASYLRTLTLVTESEAIRDFLAITSAAGDVVCAPLTASRMAATLEQISQQLGVGRRAEVAELAGQELGRRALRGPLEMCESVALVEDGVRPEYYQAYYFRLGPARAKKDLLIIAKTEWDP